ncbi:MAG TPA: pilus assembly protein N-terminal domain-containing protein [Gemmataceae bacterium]|nr:pilus assembly protein N-terminal domain-containing protein [Gemmataceae bacterium]
MDNRQANSKEAIFGRGSRSRRLALSLAVGAVLAMAACHWISTSQAQQKDKPAATPPRKFEIPAPKEVKEVQVPEVPVLDVTPTSPMIPIPGIPAGPVGVPKAQAPVTPIMQVEPPTYKEIVIPANEVGAQPPFVPMDGAMQVQVPVPQPKVPQPKGADEPPLLPQPRPLVPPFGPDQVRMPLIGDTDVAPLGATPRPTAKELQEYAKYVKGFVDPNNTLDLIKGRARLMILKETPKRIQISDETIASYNVFPNSKDMTILGKLTGTTVLNFWFASAEDKTKETVLSYLVRVFPDPEEKARMERVFKALELEINKKFPDSLVKLDLVGDKVVVSGQAHDIQEAAQILKLVVSNTPGASKIPSEGIPNSPRPDQPDGGPATPGSANYLSSGSPNVINMLRVAGVQQVMLRVVVAEVNRTAARSIGMNFSLSNKQGITVSENRTGGLVVPGAGLGIGSLANTVGNAAAGTTALANLPINLDNGQLALAVNALKKLSYAKSLAEPNLVTLNGQPAFFLAGGQFPVPVVTGTVGGAGLQGISYVPFGVQLRFTPYITDKDRIRLNVSATVSTRDPSTGTTVGTSNVAGLTARTFFSTIEMRDGQTLAVAGLIQTNHGADRDQIPFLGTIPVLNRFTGFDRTSAGEQELVILITPELVQPMHAHQLPRLVGSDMFEPSDLEFYLLGRLEGRRPVDFRSPVMNDFHRIRQYNRCEQRYIFGPSGHHNIQSPPN